jgi:Ca2+-binding RTX toxin-like protein
MVSSLLGGLSTNRPHNVGAKVGAGGAGADTFVFNSNFGKETITDFDVNHDVLAFDSHLFSNDTVSQVLSQTHDSSAGAVIAVDAHEWRHVHFSPEGDIV